MFSVKSVSNQIAVLLFAVGFLFQTAGYADAPKALSPEDIAKITAEAQKTLNATRWEVEVTPTTGKKEDRKSEADVVLFKDGKLHSEGLAKKGFGTSNYTLTIGDDGVPVFETMQRNTEDGVVFWRGELVEGQIRGVISVQVPKQPAEAFGFRGAQAGEVTEIPAERLEPQPEPVPETVEVPAEPVVEAVTEAVVSEEGTEAVVADTVAAVEEAVAPAIEEVPAAEPVVEETKPAKQPWWAPKKK